MWINLLESIFPRHCLVCKEEGAWLCPICQKKLKTVKASFCPFCLKLTTDYKTCPSCRKKYHLNGLISIYYFEPTIKRVIYQYKYRRSKDIANFLIKISIEKLKKSLPQDIDMTIPIPLHILSKSKRGFNQSEIFTKELAKKFNLKYSNKILSKTKLTRTQSKLSREERENNVKGSFRSRTVNNHNILLVDDVFTTGSTMDEAAKTLKKSGAKQVWGLTIAKR
jgi:ComF family protein